jgi:hypothetical protein
VVIKAAQGVSLAPVAAVNAGWSVAIEFYATLECSMRSMPTASRPPSSHE